MEDTDWLLHSFRPNIKSTVNESKIQFKDVDCDYLMSPKYNKLLIENNDAIINHIKNLLSTPLGSEDFEPKYGSNLPYRIMEPVTPFTAFSIETDTITALLTWMSDRIRVVLSESFVEPLPSGEGYLVQITYVNLLSNTLGLFKQEVVR